MESATVTIEETESASPKQALMPFDAAASTAWAVPLRLLRPLIQHIGKRLRAFGSIIVQPASLNCLRKKRQIRFLRGIQTA